MAVDAAGDRPLLRRDAERNRARILEAARAVFAERGLDVSMDEIARCAGVGVGTVYRRFPDREDLIDALFEDRIGEIEVAAAAAAGHADAWEGLVEFLESMLKTQAEDRGLREVLVSSVHGRLRLEAARGRIKPLIEGVVARAQAAGALRPDVAAADLPLISVMLSTVADYSRAVSPDVWRRCLGLLLDGLRTAREAPTPLPAPPLSDEQLEQAMACWKPRPG